MSSTFIFWLVVLAASGTLCLVLPNPSDSGGSAAGPGKINPRKLARVIFISLLTVFVIFMLLSAGRKGSIARSEPTLDVDRAEIALRIENAVDAMYQAMPVKTVPSPRKPGEPAHADARKVLQDSLNRNPESFSTQTKLVIVLGDGGSPGDRRELRHLVRSMTDSKEENERQLGKALEQLYLSNHVPKSQVPQLESTLKDNIRPGWYRNAVTLRLYKVAGEEQKYEALRSQVLDEGAALLLRLTALLAFGLLAVLVGVITIIVQLFTMPRHIGQRADERGGSEAAPWGLGTVYSILVMWLATQVIIGGVAHSVVKQMGLMSAGATEAALATGAVYLVSNGPGIFYVYWFACRPHKVGLFDFLRLRLKTEKGGPLKMIASGVLTWCAALPVVIVAYALAARFLGSQGSSNPVIGLVMEAARSADYLAVILFYFTLGVLAPLCEETLFRGFLYRTMRKYVGVGTGLLISASLFALVHLDFGAMLPLLCLGWMFGYVFERTRSLVPSMVAHGCWNSGTFTLMLMLFG